MKEITITITAEEAKVILPILERASEETASPIIEEAADSVYWKIKKAEA